MGASECTACDIGFYNPDEGAGQCNACPSGRQTPLLGAVEVSDCLSPLPNFVSGFISLLLGSVLCGVYFAKGRVHRVGFLRKERPLGNVVMESEEICEKLVEMLKLHHAAQATKLKASVFFRLFGFIVFLIPGLQLNIENSKWDM